MTTVEDMLEKMLRRDEGERLRVYTDTLGHSTIGVGRSLDTQGITSAEADYLLLGDMYRVEAEAAKNFPWAEGLAPERLAVLLSMLFQIGLPKLLHFTEFLTAMEHKNWSRAAAEMRDSEWHKQTPVRCERLAVQMETGIFQP